MLVILHIACKLYHKISIFHIKKKKNIEKTIMAHWHETIYLGPGPVPDAPLTLHAAGITHPDPEYRIARRNLQEFYVLEYVLRGHGELVCDGEHYKISAGDVYFLQPGSTHEYYSDRRDPWEKVWVNVGGKLMDSLCEAYRLHGLVYFHNCRMESDFMEALALVRQWGAGTDLAISLQLHRILANLREWRDLHPEMRHSADGIRLKEFMDSHWQEDISVEDLAAVIRKSPAQVRRIFQRDWQMSPHRYLCRQRVFYACQYLENTEYPIKILASRLGFRDEFYFSNWFRKEKGIAPTQYRKQFR